MEEKRKKGRGQRRNKEVMQHRFSIIAISCVLVMLTGVLMLNSISLYKKNEKYKVQEAELKEQLLAEEERSKEIDELEEYIFTDEYAEEVAKDKLGLAYPDELYFEAE